MAPYFWLKRQLPLSDILNPRPTSEPSVPVEPRPTSSESEPPTEPTNNPEPEPTNRSTAAPSNSSPVRPTSVSNPSRPTSETDDDPPPTGIEEEPENTEVVLDPTPTLEASNNNAEAPAASTIIQSETIVVEPPPDNSGIANVGAAATNGNSFLENKPLAGAVFGICGLVGLLIIIGIIMLATRKARRTRKLEQEIISWDPDHTTNFHANRDTSDTRSIEELEEKRRSPSSLDGPTYAYGLPPNKTNLQRNPSTFQQPINVALPTHGQHQYNAQPYPLHQGW
ncbi:hypothetical protein FA15DRAFT_664284 [Coprinopsis marcescibilis]|uniref:Uncharacterized protein n=1 Tax=Coprinopsis marcescibilis TaxID=230819 RepID=A0A5C3LBG6_COPMA|nr:hypothetical protein FA15DRAFT_664284 [Coprinopsis marcescibilis]